MGESNMKKSKWLGIIAIGLTVATLWSFASRASDNKRTGVAKFASSQEIVSTSETVTEDCHEE